MPRQSPRKTAKASKPVEPRLSRTRRPPELPVADWQAALRRQFGREQHFGLENLGSEPVFSVFRVHNPANQTHYRVTIRGQMPGQSTCTCPDYATNDLGTCKHIEFTLSQLQAKRGGKAALARGFQPAYSDIWLDCCGARQVRFRAGSGCPEAVLKLASQLFDTDAQWALRPDHQGERAHLLQAAQTSGHELRCSDDAWQFIAHAGCRTPPKHAVMGCAHSARASTATRCFAKSPTTKRWHAMPI